jgi:hypothetical protein
VTLVLRLGGTLSGVIDERLTLVPPILRIVRGNQVPEKLAS